MKQRRRLLLALIIVLVFNIVVRAGNCCVLAFGDNSKKNVCALDASSLLVWATISGGELEITMDDLFHAQKEEGILKSDSGFEVDNSYDGIWGLLGGLGIHNYSESVDDIYIYIDSIKYTFSISIVDEMNCFDYEDYKCWFLFRYAGDEVIVDDINGIENDELLEKYINDVKFYKETIDNVLEEYKKLMIEFSIKAFIAEFIILIISIYLLIKLIKERKKSFMEIYNDKSIFETYTVEVLEKNMALTYGMIEILLCSAVIGIGICIWNSMGNFYGISYTNLFIYFIIYFMPAYILLAIVCVIVYLSKVK